jgi:anti-anti-sigma regulatory factor
MKRGMEIAIAKKGGMRVLAVKGNLRLQHWRVIDKHLDALLGQGARWVVLDLSGANLIGDAALGALFHCARRFLVHDANLLLLAIEPRLRETLRNSAGTELAERVFPDWRSLEEWAQGRGCPFPDGTPELRRP